MQDTDNAEVKTYQCQECEDKPIFNSLSGLRYHSIKYHGHSVSDKIGATCPDCGYVSSLGGVNLHRRLRHGIPSPHTKSKITKKRAKKPSQGYDCSYCDYTTSTRAHLTSHKRRNHPNETGLVNLHRPAKAAPVIRPESHLNFCPNCGENLNNWKK